MMDGGGSQMRKRKLKKKKRATQAFKEPTDKDSLMARVYGGAVKGGPKKMLPSGMAKNTSQASNINLRDPNKMSRVAGSVSGYHKDMSSREE